MEKSVAAPGEVCEEIISMQMHLIIGSPKGCLFLCFTDRDMGVLLVFV